MLLQPRQRWRGQGTEGDLLTSVAARLLGYVLTAWPRSKKEGRLLGSNPAPVERAPTAQAEGWPRTPQRNNARQKCQLNSMWRSKLRCNLGTETEIPSKAANRKQSQPATPSKGLEGRGMVTSAYQGTLRSKHLEARCSLPPNPVLPGGATTEVASGMNVSWFSGWGETTSSGVSGNRGATAAASLRVWDTPA